MSEAFVRIGELEMTGENQSEVDAYFVPDFKFHAPGGGEGITRVSRATSGPSVPPSMA